MKKKTQQTLNLSFAEVEPQEIKAALVDKYGSLSHFCRLTNRDVYELNTRLRCKTQKSTAYMEKVFADAKCTPNGPKEGYNLTATGREKLKAALGQYPTITAFCAQHTAFSSVFISRVLHGGTGKVTRKVTALANTLQVELVTPKKIQRNGSL